MNVLTYSTNKNKLKPYKKMNKKQTFKYKSQRTSFIIVSVIYNKFYSLQNLINRWYCDLIQTELCSYLSKSGGLFMFEIIRFCMS